MQSLIFLSFILLFCPARAAAQESKNENKITITSFVKDGNGNPVKGAIVNGNQGAVYAKTDASGKFTVTVSILSDLLIESDGYEPALFKAEEISTLKEFPLKASLFMHGQKDAVNVAFGKVSKGDLVNSVSVIDPNEVRRYDNIESISDVLNGRVTGLLGSNNIRGIGAPLYIVDGLPRDISNINLSEVAQITILKDLNSSILYGNLADHGVVLITTKRGEAYKRKIDVTAYYGVSKPVELPKFLSSANYQELYNEARVNDGLDPQYDALSINNYRTGNQYRYPNVDYFSNQYLKSIKPFFRVMSEFSGGNDISTFYANVGWTQSDNLINFGAGENAKNNSFNVRGNVDMKINSLIKASLDGAIVIGSNAGPVGNYWANAYTVKPNLLAPLIPINLIIPNIENNTLVQGRKTDVGGIYLPGGTSNQLTNLIADTYYGGNNVSKTTSFSVNQKIDFDLKQITKGLSFHTNLSFDLYSSYDLNIANSYSVYLPTWKAGVDSIASLEKYGTDARTGTQNVNNSYFTRRIGFYGLLDYDRTFGGVHHFTGSFLGFQSGYKQQNNIFGQTNINLGLRLGYSYNNKYLVDFSGAVVSSGKLPAATRRALSPSLGIAWVMSSEEFMSTVTAINYLKFRVSGGIMNTDKGISGYYYYDSPYWGSGSYAWDEGSYSNRGTIPGYGANPGLNYEKRKDINIGFESILFDHTFSLEGNLFTQQYSDVVTRPMTIYPSFFTNYIPFKNNDEYSYLGAELGLSFNKSFGDLTFLFGANALYADSRVVTKDEVWMNKYQYRAGRPVDAIFGLVSTGFFKDQTDIANSPVQSFGMVKPGDIKYVNQDGNSVVDANDQVQIGRSQAPYSYGLNLKISYKNFTLFANGTGRIGADRIISGDYYWVDGNKKYSSYVLNRWTTATATTATYPRLSSVANPNNYQNSTFWLIRDNYFTMNRMQLTYEMPESVTQMLRMKKISFFVDGSNLFTISKHNDIRNLALGSEPLYRSYSLGIKTVF